MGVGSFACLLVRHSICRVAHEPLDVLDLHLGIELLEHSASLLDAEQDILLHQGELD